MIGDNINSIIRRQFKILVIDDDDAFRRSLCFKLKRKYRAHVEEASSGKAGIARLEEGHSYDIVFTDIMMPGMTGIDVYHALRRIDADIRIVIMSAYSDSAEWANAQALEDVALLHKPIPEDKLIELLSV